jgi:ribosomal protein S18 acetylase RimI-like enzyme
MRLEPTTLRELRPSEFTNAASLLSRAMRDNPINVQAFGHDANRRGRTLSPFFEAAVRGLARRGSIVGAFTGDVLLGVCAATPPGHCQPTWTEKLSVLPTVLLGQSLLTPIRVSNWVREWSRRDLAESHWHVGPVAVDVHVQGRGVGAAMMTEFCAHMDINRTIAYLETDKATNVRFYETFGFAVVTEAQVLGVPNWFMSRPLAQGRPFSISQPSRAERERGRCDSNRSNSRPDHAFMVFGSRWRISRDE